MLNIKIIKNLNRCQDNTFLKLQIHHYQEHILSFCACSRSSDFVDQNVTRHLKRSVIPEKHGGPRPTERLLARISLWIQCLSLRRGGMSLSSTAKNSCRKQVGWERLSVHLITFVCGVFCVSGLSLWIMRYAVSGPFSLCLSYSNSLWYW